MVRRQQRTYEITLPCATARELYFVQELKRLHKAILPQPAVLTPYMVAAKQRADRALHYKPLTPRETFLQGMLARLHEAVLKT